MASPPQRIQPPNRLKAKVGDGGALTPEMERRAQAAVGSLAMMFPELALEQVDAMIKLHAGAAADRKARPGILLQIHEIAHDLRGQGSSFGYPLITRVGSSLAGLAEEAKRFDDDVMEVVRAHLLTLRAILAEDLTDATDKLTRQTVEGLEHAVRKVLEK